MSWMPLVWHKEEFVVAITLLGCFIALICDLAFGRGNLTWNIGLISALPSLMVCWFAARQKTIITPFVLFSGGYGLYHGALLLSLSFMDVIDYPYPIGITNDTIHKSALLSALGAIAIALVWLFRPDRAPLHAFRLNPAKTKSVFGVGVALFLVSLGSYTYQIIRMGGFIAAASIERVERLARFKDGHLPYLSFATISVALLFIGSQGRIKQRRFAWLSLMLWVGLHGIQGDRISVLRFLLAMAAALATSQPHIFRLRALTIACIALIGIGGLEFAQIRMLIPLYLQGVDLSAYLYTSSDSWKLLMPENSEFKGSYLSILDAVSNPHGMLLGETYLTSPLALLPDALYPGKKPEDLADVVSESVAAGDQYVMGWTYSPVAEAYINFGALGVPVIMAGWAFLFLWLGTMQTRSLWGLLCSALFMQQAFIVHRGDFRWFCGVAASSTAALLITMASLKLLSQRSESIHERDWFNMRSTIGQGRTYSNEQEL